MKSRSEIFPAAGLVHHFVLSAVLLFAMLPSSGLFAQNQDLRYLMVTLDRECGAETLRSIPSVDPHLIQGGEDGIIAILRLDDIPRLESSGCSWSIVIDDLESWYRDRAVAEMEKLSPPASLSVDRDPENFRLGPVGGSYTLEEFASITDSMASLYPELVTISTVGQSVQGRPIRMITIESDAPGSHLRPRALYTGLHHAREPMSMVNLVYTMWFLLEGNGRDTNVTNLLERRTLHFVPIVNPDGYQKNLDDSPQGGGMWRKNLRNSFGVDLNRNYGPTVNWMNPPEGADDSPASPNYRGPAPFSEPEIVAIRDLYDSIPVAVSLHHHSAGDVLLYAHDDLYSRSTGGEWRVWSAATLSGATGCGFAPSFLGIGYSSSGTATAFARDVAPLAGYAWTAESGTLEDGFWPAPSRYLPLCREFLEMNLRLARIAGPYLTLDNAEVLPDGAISITLRNVGVESLENADVDVPGSFLATGKLDPGQAVTLSVPAERASALLQSARNDIPMVIRIEGFRDTIDLNLLGVDRELLFEDRFEGDLSSWNPGLWGIETAEGARRVLADSPYEMTLYSSLSNECQLDRIIDLRGYEAAELEFDGKGTLQGMSYGLRVEARGVGDPDWSSLEGDLFQRENDPEGVGTTVMRGDHDVWRRYHLNLDAFTGREVELRLSIRTDARYSLELSEGVLIDNLRITGGRSISDVPRLNNPIPLPESILYAPLSGTNGLQNAIRQLRGLGAERYRVADIRGVTLLNTNSFSRLQEVLDQSPGGLYFLTADLPEPRTIRVLRP